jgi:hypothetical protein
VNTVTFVVKIQQQRLYAQASQAIMRAHSKPAEGAVLKD